jgi:AcrR family transcriptional regulator
MDEVKPQKRTYNSTRRREQALATRRQILEGARRLFLTYGYSGTTIEAIAVEAGVAVETVYAGFGNKRTMLAQLFDIAVVGDEEPVPLLDRAGPQEILRLHDQREQVELFTASIRSIMERVGPLFEIMRVAAATEVEIAALLAERLSQRMEGMQFFVRSLLNNGPLREGLSSAEATDIVWTLTSPEVHRLLTVDRGWPAEKYQAWLTDSLGALLLPS